MKPFVKTILLFSGWLLCFLFVGSSYLFNQFSKTTSYAFQPITWENHRTVFEGALSCSLTSKELRARKATLKKEIFPRLQKKTTLADGFIYYFDDEQGLAEKIMEFIAKEKQCCPFFQFDLSILPFQKGMALKISGSKAVKEFLADMEDDL